MSIWKQLHILIAVLNRDGVDAAGRLLATAPEPDKIRMLAYHMFVMCERKKLAKDARVYNLFIEVWDEMRAAG